MQMDAVWNRFCGLEHDAETRQLVNELKTFLSESHCLASNILVGQSQAELQAKHMRELEKHVHDALGCGSDVRYGKLLRSFVEYANRVGGYEFPLPAIPIRLEAQPSVFATHPPKQAERAENWRTSLMGWLEKHSVSEAPELVGLGALLVSASLNSGLAYSSALFQLANLANSRLVVIQDRGYVDFQMPWRGSDNLERRRWFPDAVSELIFLQLDTHLEACSKQKSPAKALWPLIRGWFKSCESIADPPRNFSDFILAAQALNYHELPVHVAAFMGREHISHSLRPEVWQRLHGMHGQPDAIAGYSGEYAGAKEVASPVKRIDEESVETFEWGADLWEILRSEDREGAGNKLEALLKQEAHRGTSERVLIEWAHTLCTKAASSGKRIKLSTIRQYLQQTGKRIAALAGSSDIVSFTVTEFEELYVEVMSDAESASMRDNLQTGLREFHHFLSRCYGVPELSKIMKLGAGSILHPVDANLISVDEYQEVRQSIREADLDLIAEDLPLIVELVFILGFRCGLRRMETLMLRIQDIHLLGMSELIVRRYSGHRLKTANAKRKLPIYALLDEEELSLLTAWVEKRQKQEAASPVTDALFSVPEKGWLPVDQDKVIPVLHRLMREVTGDPSIRYHHLRHSFATWTFLSLALADHPKRMELLPNQPRTENWLNEATEFARRLLGPKHRPTLYAIARLLGHAGPDMSLEHYIHSMDLAAMLIDERRVSFDEKSLVAASNLPVSTGYRLLKQAGVLGLLRRIRSDYPHRVVELHPNERPQPTSSQDEQTLFNLLSTIQRFLNLRQRTSIDRSVLAERCGLSEEEASLVEEEAAYLARLRSNDQRPNSSRHRFQECVSGDETTESPEVELHTQPRTEASKAIYQDYAQRLERLFCDDSALVWEVVTYYVHHQWKTWNALIFHHPQKPAMARKYMTFLARLGFRRSELQFICCDPRQRSSSLALWKKALGLTSRDRVKRRDPTNNCSKAVANWLFIAPNLAPDDLESDDRLFGYRYLMIMVAIAKPVIQLRGPVSIPADTISEVLAKADPETSQVVRIRRQ